jgi:hypothetical protein
MKTMGPGGLARSAGQALYDFAINDIEDILGTRERFGSLIYDKHIVDDKPTPYFFMVWDSVYPHSMVKNNVVTFTAMLARIAAVVMISDGTLHAVKEDNDKG